MTNNILTILGSILVLAFLGIGFDDAEYLSQDINKTSHRAETGSFIMIGADEHVIWLENNPNATNVTMEQLVMFLKADKTNEIPYNDNTFICADYAEVVHNNAETQGIRSGWVSVDMYMEYTGHAINVFDTSDYGLVFYDGTNSESGLCNLETFVLIEPYKRITPINGDLLFDETYFEVNDPTDNKYYYECNYYASNVEGLVENYEIIW